MPKFVEYTDFYGDVVLFNVDHIVSICKMPDGATIHFSHPVYGKGYALEIGRPYEEVVATVCGQSEIPTLSCKE